MPEVSPSDQFQRVLTVAEEQFRKNKISVRFGPLGAMRFIIDEASLKEALSVSGFEEPTFRTIFDNEIGPLLEAVIRGSVEQYIETRYLMESKEQRAPQRAILRERAAIIEKSLATPTLRGRYLIKISSKHSRLQASEWEVARKTDLSSKKQHPYLHPYATISFETISPVEPPSRMLPWFSFFWSEPVGRAEFCVFDCDEGDLDDLIDCLQQAKTALRRAQGENGT
ncbi:MAG TPA: hypothetical protein VMF91_20830 [Bryobacteraceae bacterium]|nr:hypothetical protein [Bryobacteraceae bacterium]